MNTSIRESFDTRIQVAGFTVAPNTLVGGDQADEGVVTLTGTGVALTLTPAAACALAAALQSVAVYQMEQQPREIKRRTEPGAPSFEEVL